jgi:hypothetical protein
MIRGGAKESTQGFPTVDEAIVNEAFLAPNNGVTFRAEFEGRPCSYHYHASSEKIASRIQITIAKSGVGTTVAAMGEIEIEIED